MNFTFDKSEFLDCLSPAMGMVGSKGAIPVIEGVLIESIDTNTLRLSTFDMQKGFRATFSSSDITEEGRTIIHAGRLMQIVRLLPEGECRLEVDKNFNVTISGGNSQFSLFAINEYDFPSMPELRGDKTFTLSSSLFRSMIGKVLHSVAEKDSRQALCGAYFNFFDDQLEVVSCDSFSLSRCFADCAEEGKEKNAGVGSFIIPLHALQELLRVLSGSEKELTIEMARKHAIFKVDNILLFTRMIDGDYIDYERIMPTAQTIFIESDRLSFLEALERASLVAEENIKGSGRSYVKITVSGEEMTLSALSVNGKVEDCVSVIHQGEDIEIGFNCRFLINAVRAADSERIKITMKSAVQSITIEPVEKESHRKFFYMVLPVRMN